MKDVLVTGGKLFLITAVAAVLLGFVSAVTEPVIKQRKEMELKQALSFLVPGGKPEKEIVIKNNPVVRGCYPVKENGRVRAYILNLIGKGYGGDLKILAAFKRNGEIISVKLMEDQETPGLGKKAEKESYMKKFIGTGGSKPVPVRKDMLSRKDADAVTGASITFMGIANALAAGSDFIKKMGKSGSSDGCGCGQS